MEKRDCAAIGPDAAHETSYTHVWDRICRHLDGLGIGSTVAALHERGVLGWLKSKSDVTVSALLNEFGGNSGYIQLALRLFACQGWLAFLSSDDEENPRFSLTPEGRLATACAPLYVRALSYMNELRGLGANVPADTRLLAQLEAEVRCDWNLRAEELTPKLHWQITGHLDGHIVGLVLYWLAKERILTRSILQAGPISLCAAESRLLRPACAILAAQGWLLLGDQQAQISSDGSYALACAKQYWYPIAYLDTLIRVPQLLFEHSPAPSTYMDAEETHVDRALDVEFSGNVFTTTCRKAFEEMLIPLFSYPGRHNEITAIVDTGCGDGSLLACAYRAILARTARKPESLIMIGVEPSDVARRIAAARLSVEQARHLIFEGDVTKPQEIARQLVAKGIDPINSLHVSKSVIHNRRYVAPALASDSDLRSSNVFTLPDGSRIRPGYLEQNLVEHFQAWRPLTAAHGMIVIEAHTAPARTAANLLGRSIVTLVDSLHGYSNQYLVEPQVFMTAAHKVGYRSISHVDLGQKTTGHVCLTLDHFV